ncbi:multidrug ABC transporter ATP-binding protein [Kosakonia radicincitans DSM 16656]|uniref:ABC-2 type transport system ATP-binding protein n=1 Tax=Kosakonia radicincitans TaxID=283686 RepID=A0AAX2EPU3_9ENTR|nr:MULTISPECIES: ABC transporter ATP-binding protein [Kosakonia]MDP9565762.1 ABC-2 type transport system ATP-binding protein [Kosakonia oryzae]APG19688.1 multidrug ABC transporter ATP-binding protein [Kosakonia radicincitans]ARD59186.1 multidrug ABC transporter ATP-binding protein [Kosakonia radicincitans DSM 16656]KDE35556.1 multidrug ABC transporter ATP-binding protein [Kosakonia radicincitans UMEnt01/12]MDD7995983.1 ABC transporter ATP-binding protein [Kosakonia radicincitans]
MMDYCIKLQNVNKSFGSRHVVKDLTLNIPTGKITGFLGPNGSGKTTAMRMMCGLLKPDSGSGSCFDFDIFKQRESIKPMIGYMTQYFSLWENLTVRENLLFLAKIRNIPQPIKRVEELINEFALQRFRDVLTHHLSGGWKQRVSLSASILHDPKIILLDEPTAGVDPYARREFWKILHYLSSKGMTILVSTHYMDEAERCNHLAWMSYGNLLASGSAESIIQSQGLTTFAIKGPNLHDLEYRFSDIDEIEQTVIFSNTLFVTSKQSNTLNTIVGALPDNYHVEKTATTLEDSFAHLMKQAVPI